jgi:hypothetical protein
MVVEEDIEGEGGGEENKQKCKLSEVHGLRRCTNTEECGIYLSRDIGASKNIHGVAVTLLNDIFEGADAVSETAVLHATDVSNKIIFSSGILPSPDLIAWKRL